MDPSQIEEACRILRQGGLVAFPTETVYGLGADAGNDEALRAVFKVKGRPENHPLIVHLGSAGQLSEWASDVPDAARQAARRFWPGPLTLVLRKAARVSKVATGGQETVGLRVPDHPVALSLLKAFKGGVAAPSANPFGRVSPTCADHVRRDLGNRVDLILDGGPCSVGVESTIVDFSGGNPEILRPGGLTRESLEQALGQPVPIRGSGPVRVSGQLASHYAPSARVIIVAPGEGRRLEEELKAQGKKVVLLAGGDLDARRLYSSLRQADDSGAEVVLVALPVESGLGVAVADRLRKAAGPR